MNVFTWSRKIIFVDCKRKFAQDVHGCMGIFTEETWLIFWKGNIREPMQGFDFPVFADCCQQFSDWGIGTENIITSITCTNAIFLRAKIGFSKRFWIEFGVHLKKRRKRNRNLFRRFMYRTQAWIITALVSLCFVTIRSKQYRRFQRQSSVLLRSAGMHLLETGYSAEHRWRPESRFHGFLPRSRRLCLQVLQIGVHGDLFGQSLIGLIKS